MDDENEKIDNGIEFNENLASNDNNSSHNCAVERKITQTDHLNKQLLNAFLERLNTKTENVQDKEGGTTDVEWVETTDETDEITSSLKNGIKLKNVFIIGISGPSNSGKTSLTSCLKKSLPGSAHICQDDYFHPPGDKRLTWIPEVQHHNWEVFSSLDMDSMVRDVKKIKEIWMEEVQDKPSILLVEGFTIFNYGPLNELFDKRYFLVTSKETCEQRRLTRDYNPPDVPGYFDKVVWPHYIQAYSEIMERDDINFIKEDMSKEEIFTQVKNDIDIYLESL
ncbi:nicotinamide riboside kinase 1-like isoform X1 [Mytilus galloprovincialis]|uniref:nicotinamide riboside kinase 1-like isoform X1 n=1 Tax=Mytilus galloprovincialis TaxID=29158 RepID=UPI003F7CB93F